MICAINKHQSLIATRFVIFTYSLDRIWDRVVPLLDLEMIQKFETAVAYLTVWNEWGVIDNMDRGRYYVCSIDSLKIIT